MCDLDLLILRDLRRRPPTIIGKGALKGFGVVDGGCSGKGALKGGGEVDGGCAGKGADGEGILTGY